MTALPRYTYPGVPQRVRFLERPNRFLARVRPESGGVSFWAHVPNPGRNEELLRPGRTIGCVVPVPRNPDRRTHHDLVAVRHGRTWVGLDTQVSNLLALRLLEHGAEPGFGSGPWQREVGGYGHRWDLAQRGLDGRITHLVEVKSSNLRIGRRALFPDAPTERGTHHVRALATAARRGVRTGLLFAIQRDDVESFQPNAEMDPDFAAAVRHARSAGVRFSAWTLRVGLGTLEWGRRVPVDLGDPLGRSGGGFLESEAALGSNA
ncbi:MAG: DNA/RNA nuclease SfsA [Thermoplasmata archaeon]|nr:DNA/RNA nuclease SfsA [Thermoplasmata archaeon]